jgi:hypothetical protein
MSGNRRRAVVAVLLGTLAATVGIAGAGHLYLRKWRRAAAWFTLVIGVGVVLVWTFTDPAATAEASVMEASASMPPAVYLPMLFLLLVSVVDAYRLARAGPDDDAGAGAGDAAGSDEDGPTCPNCGKAVDPGLDFCHWCTERLPSESAGGNGPGADGDLDA